MSYVQLENEIEIDKLGRVVIKNNELINAIAGARQEAGGDIIPLDGACGNNGGCSNDSCGQ